MQPIFVHNANYEEMAVLCHSFILPTTVLAYAELIFNIGSEGVLNAREILTPSVNHNISK